MDLRIGHLSRPSRVILAASAAYSTVATQGRQYRVDVSGV